MEDYDENEIYHEMYIHFLWSTKNQRPVISSSIIKNLWLHIYEVALSYDCHLIGGQIFNDHIQLIIKITPDIAVADLITTLKTASALWIRTNCLDLKNFEWQKSDFAFTSGYEQLDALLKKIKNTQHFIDEVHALLNENEIQYELQEVLE